MGKKTPKKPTSVQSDSSATTLEAAHVDTHSTARTATATTATTTPEGKPIDLSSLAEIKHALDDTIKEILTSPSHPYSFLQSHSSTDLKLLLGYASNVIAFITAYYAWKKDDFEGTKAAVAVGVGLYMVLSTVLTLYVVYVEKDTIFVGKKRTLQARISTEHLQLSSLTYLSPTSPPPSPVPSFLPSIFQPSSSFSPLPETSDKDNYPLYILSIQYSDSINKGKVLLHKNEKVKSWYVGDLLSADGKVVRGKLEEVVKGLMGEVTGKE